MKKLMMLLVVIALSTSAYAATKCQSDGKGGLCCWDTEKDGPYKPVGC
jgi:hypothetical protein